MLHNAVGRGVVTVATHWCTLCHAPYGQPVDNTADPRPLAVPLHAQATASAYRLPIRTHTHVPTHVPTHTVAHLHTRSPWLQRCSHTVPQHTVRYRQSWYSRRDRRTYRLGTGCMWSSQRQSTAPQGTPLGWVMWTPRCTRTLPGTVLHTGHSTPPPECRTTQGGSPHSSLHPRDCTVRQGTSRRTGWLSWTQTHRRIPLHMDLHGQKDQPVTTAHTTPGSRHRHCPSPTPTISSIPPPCPPPAPWVCACSRVAARATALVHTEGQRVRDTL